jgi:predicted HTH transcriptional regulator
MSLPNRNAEPPEFIQRSKQISEERVLTVIQKNGSITRKQAEVMLGMYGISKKSTELLLSRMTERGELRREGSSRD